MTISRPSRHTTPHNHLHRLLTYSLVLLIGVCMCGSAWAKRPVLPLSMQPLDLSHPPSTDELIAAGQRAGQLFPSDAQDEPVFDLTPAPTRRGGAASR